MDMRQSFRNDHNSHCSRKFCPEKRIKKLFSKFDLYMKLHVLGFRFPCFEGKLFWNLLIDKSAVRRKFFQHSFVDIQLSDSSPIAFQIFFRFLNADLIKFQLRIMLELVDTCMHVAHPNNWSNSVSFWKVQ